ncbi:MAG: hypothetical protein IMZ64_12415, partial [Bacteroidetes bacterium]|nr:hypothetical protein [Bacteroidota bacterium]
MKIIKRNYFKYAALAVVITGVFSLGFILRDNQLTGLNFLTNDRPATGENAQVIPEKNPDKSGIKEDIKPMPVYGHWRNFTTKDGLPSDKAYCVRIDGDRVLVGTHDGLAVYEKGKWTTYTTKEGLAHNGIVSIDVSELTGDVWIGTLGGLSRWSGGKFENFTQFNSGMPNDLVYCVICDGKDVWVATGGGAGHYD